MPAPVMISSGPDAPPAAQYSTLARCAGLKPRRYGTASSATVIPAGMRR